MKKVILGTAAILFTAFGMAQAPSTPTPQAPNSPTGGVPMIGTENLGESVQNGNDNKVRVRQIGQQNTVYTNQNNGSGDGDNKAAVRQAGSMMGSTGEMNAAEVRQSGSDNESRSFQIGDRNQAFTHQGQTDDGSMNNQAHIRQGINDNAQMNYAGIVQDGDYNKAKTVQIFDNHEAWTQQNGEGNESSIDQNGSMDGSAGHIAFVDQAGDYNQSVIDQDGPTTNIANDIQHGNGNYSKQTQTSTGTGHTALINQGGDNPTMAGVEGNGRWNFLNDNVDDLTNYGAPGTTSENGIAFQTQTGENNKAQIHQFGSADRGSNYAEQNQNGENGRTFIYQNAHGSTVGGDNQARQDQTATSTRSLAALAQNGASHFAYQIQTDGDRNHIHSTQRGEGNQLFAVQTGDNNRAWTAQRGKWNKINLQQKDGQSYIVNQNLPQAGLIGTGVPNGGNWADIVQVGPGGDPNATLDCDFPGQMSKMPVTTPNDLTIADPCPDCP
jgi:hypothetical protein